MDLQPSSRPSQPLIVPPRPPLSLHRQSPTLAFRSHPTLSFRLLCRRALDPAAQAVSLATGPILAALAQDQIQVRLPPLPLVHPRQRFHSTVVVLPTLRLLASQLSACFSLTTFELSSAFKALKHSRDFFEFSDGASTAQIMALLYSSFWATWSDVHNIHRAADLHWWKSF